MEKIAIIGSGIAGMSAAYFLKDHAEITLFEKNEYAGGHTNTVIVDEDGKKVPVDTGFMVFNTHTYPNLIRLFKQLGVSWKNTDMSFSVQHRPTGLEYCGSGLNGLFGQRKNLLSPSHYRMLMQINRFNKESVLALEEPGFENYSMKDYVEKMGYGHDFLYKYLSPMSSALWSTPTDVTLTFPARALIRFFKNHGFLGLNTQFQWLTVQNGSMQYRDKIIALYRDRLILNSPVRSVTRQEDGTVILKTDAGEQQFDRVIMACHADEAISLLKNPTEEENYLLRKFAYQPNTALLHTDRSVMPATKRVWSSWNYVTNKQGDTFTVYYMNKLQQVSDKVDYFININGEESVDPSKVLKKIIYHHPVFTVEAMKAQKFLPSLNRSGSVQFCGSYFRYGFHEDALASSVDLCSKILGRNVWNKNEPVPSEEFTA